jgi:hypothetical protein
MINKPQIVYLNRTMFPCWVGVCFTEKSYIREMKRLSVEKPDAFMQSDASVKVLAKGHNETYIICYDPYSDKKRHRNEIAALLAHECVHVVDLTFRNIGEQNPGDETRAYFVQYLLVSVLYELDQFLKSKKAREK